MVDGSWLVFGGGEEKVSFGGELERCYNVRSLY